MKHSQKEESIYNNLIREGNKDVTTQLNSFLKVDKVGKQKKKEIIENEKINNTKGFSNVTDNYNETPGSGSLSYLPKRKIKFTPSTLMSYNHPNDLGKIFKSEEEKNAINSPSYSNPVQNNPFENTIPGVRINKYQTSEYDYLNFKTNYILKFAKNIENFEKFSKYFDFISENNKKSFIDHFETLKKLSEKKDRILFDVINPNNKLNNSIDNWKECSLLFYEFEVYWQKLAEVALKELKNTKDINAQLSKKLSDQTHITSSKENELNHLKIFIEKNDINYKSLLNKRKNKSVLEIKEEYDRKEKLNMITIFRLEEEIKELTNLLDKDKEYFDKYHNSLDVIEQKKREIEDLRIKYNQESDDRKLRIAYLNNEKHELNIKIGDLENELLMFKDVHENSKKEYIDFYTQIKMLKQLIEQKEENITMLTEEVDTWKSEILKEREFHYNTQQTVTALEIKIQGIRNEKITQLNSTTSY